MTEQGDALRFAVDMGFFMCGNDIFSLDMPMCEKLLYIALCRYAGSNNRAWPSHATLCRDLSCGRTRLSKAVQYLCDSGLVKKEGRGNRTNLYSLYPVSHFKKPCFEKKPEKKFEKNLKKNEEANFAGGQCSPGEQPTDSIVRHANINCSPDGPLLFATRTLSVRHADTKRNKNKTLEKNISSSEPGTVQVQEAERERNTHPLKPCKENFKEADFERVRKAFKSKKVTVKDKVIRGLLNDSSAADVCDAIKATNFDVACNPINVIRWLLRENSYCVPLMPAAAVQTVEIYNPPPEEERSAVKQLIQQAKENLRNKQLLVDTS